MVDEFESLGSRAQTLPRRKWVVVTRAPGPGAADLRGIALCQRIAEPGLVVRPDPVGDAPACCLTRTGVLKGHFCVDLSQKFPMTVEIPCHGRKFHPIFAPSCGCRRAVQTIDRGALRVSQSEDRYISGSSCSCRVKYLKRICNESHKSGVNMVSRLAVSALEVLVRARQVHEGSFAALKVDGRYSRGRRLVGAASPRARAPPQGWARESSRPGTRPESKNLIHSRKWARLRTCPRPRTSSGSCAGPPCA